MKKLTSQILRENSPNWVRTTSGNLKADFSHLSKAGLAAASSRAIKPRQSYMKKETKRLFDLMARIQAGESVTEAEQKEIDSLLEDPAIKTDFNVSLFTMLSEALDRGVMDKDTYESILGDLLRRKPESI